MGGFETRGLLWYLAKRVLSLLIIVLLIASAVFAVFFLRGDEPLPMIPWNPELKERYISDLKSNEPIPAQYLNFMAKTLSGKFFLSMSIWKNEQTGDKIYAPLTKTLGLFGAVLVPGLLLGLVLGRLSSGDREQKLTSRFARLVSLGFASLPIMSAGLLLLYFLAYQHSIRLHGSILNPFVASLPIALGSYILLMKGKERYFGSGTTTVSRPAPTSTITKLYVAWVMVIVLVADMMFDYGGLGLVTWQSINRRDDTVLIASIFLIAVTVAATNSLLDITSPFVKSRFSPRKKDVELDPSRSATDPAPPPVEDGSVGGSTMLALVAKDYLRRPLGIAALVIVLVFVILAVAAPLLATVPNPDRFENREPPSLMIGFLNPRPPSLERSLSTGFIHPLGTDYLGRDVYSELLYGARAPLLMVTILTAIALAASVATWIVAAFASVLRGTPAFMVGGVSSVFADFILAVPIFVVFLAMSYPNRPQFAFEYSTLVVLPLLVVACMFRVVRVKMPAIRRLVSSRPNPTAGRGRVCAVLTGATGSIFYASKFVVMFGFLTILVIQFFLPAPDHLLSTSWSWLSDDAYDGNAALLGDWWLILPQLILTSLLAAAVFKIMDTLEQVWVRRFGTL